MAGLRARPVEALPDRLDRRGVGVPRSARRRRRCARLRPACRTSRCSRPRPRAAAPPAMVRPSTNCSPMMRTAWRHGARGSPARRGGRRRGLRKPGRSACASSSTSTSLPVSIRPQVEALTNRLSDWPSVAGPVGRADLLGDQPVAGLLVGGAQQRLGQAHQRQALAGAEAELLQEALDHALAVGGAARLRAPGPRPRRARRRVRRRRAGCGPTGRPAPRSPQPTCRRRGRPN